MFLILTPGPYMTVQDKGRFGFQQMGIPVSGVLDSYAYRMANLLVGNPEDAAVLEITLLGPQMAVMKEADVALTGADMEMKLNFKPVPSWTTVRVQPGDLLNIQTVKNGCRGYLAVTGGIDVPEVMESRSTYVGGKIGGYNGRPMKKGDIIKSGSVEPLEKPREIPQEMIPDYSGDIRLRAIPGPQDDFFDEGMDILFKEEFMVTAKADRMGYRLQGHPIPHREEFPKSIISEPTMPGGIQIPANNQPIILLVEQTVGGYTKIATVISTDIPRIAQATPGDTVSFENVSLETAHQLLADEEKKISRLVEAMNG